MTVLVLLPHRYAAKSDGRTPTEMLTVWFRGAPVARYRPFGRMSAAGFGRLFGHRETIGFLSLQVADVRRKRPSRPFWAAFGWREWPFVIGKPSAFSGFRRKKGSCRAS